MAKKTTAPAAATSKAKKTATPEQDKPDYHRTDVKPVKPLTEGELLAKREKQAKEAAKASKK
jgi:hypothetical protein